MIDKIKELKIKSRTANKKELEAIDLELEKLSIENPEAFAEAMLNAVSETSAELDELILKEKLEEVLPIISVSYLAKNYFKKNATMVLSKVEWQYSNGKEAHFTPNELETLSKALNEIGQKLSTSASLIF